MSGREESSQLSFEQWITFVFDHPLPDPGAPHWYHDSGSGGEWWDATAAPKTTIAFLTTLFENASSALVSYSDAQANQGLYFLVNNSCSDHMFTLLDTSVFWVERKRCFSAMFTLFERFFAPRCSAHLSHLDTQGSNTSMLNPLNAVCYMWWDLLPIYGEPAEPERREVDAVCLEVMRLTLDLDSDACRESALHGLGHWKYSYPQKVQSIIDTWLAGQPVLADALKAYALAARSGRVQ